MRRGRTVAVLAALTLAACRSTSSDTGPADPTTVASPTPGPSTTTVTTTGPTAGPMTGPTAAPSAATGADAPAVFRFPTAEAIAGWRTQNDPVMGGVSTGERTWADGALVFEGVLSLASNGGFASLVSPPVVESPWSSADGVGLDVVGDGRTYVVQLRIDGQPGGWVQRFATTTGAATSVMLPWAGFEPVDRFLRPARADGPLDPTAVRTLVIYLVDAQEGPYRLALRAVR